MAELVFDEFIGIDTRPGKLGVNVPAFLEATNVGVVSGGAVASRPAMRRHAILSSESVGLYARGGYLRAVVPGGHDLQNTAPSGIIYDPIGTLSGAYLTGITLVAGGSGYTTVPLITLVGGNPTRAATAVATLTAGVITGITIVDVGAGYTSAPAVSITGGGGSGGSATASIVISGITGVTVSAPGSGYTTAPAISFSGGSPTRAATAHATVLAGAITAITVDDPGAGYTGTPTVVIAGGGGSGGAATAVVAPSAEQARLSYPLGVLDSLRAADTYGAGQVTGPYGYVAIKRSDNGLVEFHWLREPVVDGATPAATKVSLPFQPTGSLVKLSNKVWTPDLAIGAVRFSSSVHGPDDFTTVGDAGFLPTANHVSGNNAMVAVSHHRGRLAVLYHDAIQLWRVDEDPSQHAIEQVFNGPGAMLAGAVCNVKGDLIYLSRGGWRNLAQVAITGESDEKEQLGNPIRSLTDALDGVTPATSLWSQRRNQMLCAIGTTVYVLTYLPGEKLTAWTTWELPIAVQHLVELDGRLYARAGDTVYEFVDAADVDYNGDQVAATMLSRKFLLNKGMNAELMYLVIRQAGAATWTMIVDGVELTPRRYPDSIDRPIRIPLAGQCRQVQFRIQASEAWRLEGLRLEYERLY
jgi:hypothetical protein